MPEGTNLAVSSFAKAWVSWKVGLHVSEPQCGPVLLSLSPVFSISYQVPFVVVMMPIRSEDAVLSVGHFGLPLTMGLICLTFRRAL
jgi:hypothetical protein